MKHSKAVRTTVRILAAVVSLYLLLLAGLFAVMHQPSTFGRVMKHVPEPAFLLIPFRRMWMVARAGHLKVGDPAPDFTLPTSDNKGSVQLSSFQRQEPVVLIFGSYT
jgi:hypothetical protein